MNDTLCIIQARVSSTRLPGKILKEAGGMSLLEYEIRRVRRAKTIDKIVIATTDKPEDDRIAQLSEKFDMECFRGLEDDVLDRYYQCALKYPEYDTIVRLTGDCPLIDPHLIEDVIKFFGNGDYDYVSNANPPTFPDGMDTESFTRESLKTAWREARLLSEREHVTLYIVKSGKFKIGNVRAEKDYSRYRLTVDNPEDFEVIAFLIEHAAPGADFREYIKLLEANPEIMAKNMHISRNEGLAKSLREDKQV